ncbi:MAG: hypothetical protein II597_10815, partial [Prevotella sp.]|nr:hypothetical protein [Prevotella sp.]
PKTSCKTSHRPHLRPPVNVWFCLWKKSSMRLSSDALEMNECETCQLKTKTTKREVLGEVLGEVLHEVFVFIAP